MTPAERFAIFLAIFLAIVGALAWAWARDLAGRGVDKDSIIAYTTNEIAKVRLTGMNL